MLQERVEVPYRRDGQVPLADFPFLGVLLEPHRPVLLDALRLRLGAGRRLLLIVDLRQTSNRPVLRSEAGLLGLLGRRVAVPDLVLVQALRPTGLRVFAVLEEGAHAAGERACCHVVVTPRRPMLTFC